ncbi:MAG: hypothetical protein HC820_01370 [Hydrococcus sp. RM1_1_31]|nr:hypothetical protein [Hydrococcus sp. RM1_1_31]
MRIAHDYGHRAIAEAFTPCGQTRVCQLCPFFKKFVPRNKRYMLETNIYIVKPGIELTLNVRCVEIIASHISPDLKEKSCSILANQIGVAAVLSNQQSVLLALTDQQITAFPINEDNWSAKVKDSDRTLLLKFSNPKDRPLIAQLLERQLIINVQQKTNLWRLSNSRRIWYEAEPSITVDDIGAYRRYEFSAIPIENVGVGAVVDISTAFFTVSTVADFFRENQSELDLKRNQKRFENFSLRQKGQKATLWYDSGSINCNCYFEQFLKGKTCSTVQDVRVNGRTYKSLLDYYHQKGVTSIQPEDPVALVSFSGLDRPQPVAANRLRLRVMNEVLPKELKQVDKIEEETRCRYIEEFWKLLGNKPLGDNMPEINSNFWQPSEQKVKRIKCPNLLFGQNKMLIAPMNGKPQSHKDYYQQRIKLLNKFGCFKVPPTVLRNIYIEVPNSIGIEVAQKLGEDITALLSKWTGKPIKFTAQTYESFDKAIAKLRNNINNPSLVVFVFENEEPAIYFNVSYELSQWRVKRITSETLKDFYRQFKEAQVPFQLNDRQLPKGIRDWQSFIEKNALDILQLMDCIPWGIANTQQYQAQLAIDVGWDKQNFALSLLTNIFDKHDLSFQLNTVVERKLDTKRKLSTKLFFAIKLSNYSKRNT